MFIWLSRLLPIFFLGFLAISCEQTKRYVRPDVDDLRKEKSVAEIETIIVQGSENDTKIPKTLDGSTVKLRGYLRLFSPSLVLLENEDSRYFFGASLVVMDRYLREWTYWQREFVDESMYFSSLGCVENYTEILGVVGYLERYQAYSVVDIDQIIVYQDGSYSGSSEVCYDSDSRPPLPPEAVLPEGLEQ